VNSIRRHLLVALLAAVATVTVAAALVVYRTVRHEIDSVSDYHLRQVALALRDRLPGGPVAGAGVEDFDFLVQIWDRDGTRLYLSRPDSGLPEVAQLGYATVRTTGGDWRVYSADLEGIVVQVAQPVRSRQEHALSAALRTLAPVLLMLPLLALLTWRIVGRALAPLNRLAGEVSSRTPAALAPIPEAEAPEEALPLVRALNDLLARLEAALAARRAFVADAAHELRTPLAVLEMQRRLVERAPDAAERAAALADLRAGLARMTHVVHQLLALARAEPDSGTAPASEAVDLSDLVAQAVADHAVLAEAKGIDLGSANVAGSPDAARQPGGERGPLLARGHARRRGRRRPRRPPVPRGHGSRARHPRGGTRAGLRPLLPSRGPLDRGYRPRTRHREGHRRAPRGQGDARRHARGRRHRARGVPRRQPQPGRPPLRSP